MTAELQEKRFTLETFLLTTLSRVADIDGAVIVLRDKSQRTTIHKCNMACEWTDIVGALEAVKHDILTNHVSWHSTTAAGEIVPPQEGSDES